MKCYLLLKKNKLKRMIIIRLARHGRMKNPVYSIVVTHVKYISDSNCIEKLGFYNPFEKKIEQELKIDFFLIEKWMKIGSKISKRIKFLLKKKIYNVN